MPLPLVAGFVHGGLACKIRVKLDMTCLDKTRKGYDHDR